jgi:hypothetical protein
VMLGRRRRKGFGGGNDGVRWQTGGGNSDGGFRSGVHGHE